MLYFIRQTIQSYRLLYRVLFIFLSLCSFFWTSAYANDNSTLIGYPPQKIMGFLGLDTRTSSPNLADGRALDLLNVKLSPAFSLQKRYGWSVINDTLDDYDQDPTSINGIFDSEYSNGSSYTLAFVGNKLKYDNSGTWATVSGTATITDAQNDQHWLPPRRCGPPPIHCSSAG